jgi:hypothetical protein
MSPPLNIGHQSKPPSRPVPLTYGGASALPNLSSAARMLGGQVSGGQIVCPGPGHSAADRSLSVRFEPDAPDGFVVHSFAGDDAMRCRDHVRSRLGLDPFGLNGTGSAPRRDRPEAEYFYRREDGSPFLKVTRWPARPDGAKSFSQSHWEETGWTKGKPPGDPIPYRLPEPLAMPNEPVFICEGEKDADNLAAHGLVATTNPEGAGKWRAALNRWFEGRTVFVLADNDEAGRRHAIEVARQLRGAASKGKVVALPGLPEKGDVSDWIARGGEPSDLPSLCQALPDAVAVADDRSTLARFSFDGEAPIESPAWLIKNMLPPEGVAFIGGQSGAGKTFIGVDFARALATATAFFGRVCKERVGTLILAAEGAPTLASRIAVAKLAVSVDEKLPIAWLGEVPDLLKPDNVAAVAEQVRCLGAFFRNRHGVRLGAIIIDTVAAAFGLNDMNNGAEAAKVIDACRKLGAATGALVIPIHHYGKDASSGLLGSHILRAGADVILSVLADRDATTGDVKDRSLALAKSRTGVEGPIAPFELEFVSLGRDEDGEEFGACFVKPDLNNPQKVAARIKRRELPRGQRALKAAIDEALGAYSEQVRVMGDGPLVTAVRLGRVREAFSRFYVIDEDHPRKKADALRQAFKRALELLGSSYGSGSWAGENWIWAK